MIVAPTELREGSVGVICAFDHIPQHHFRVSEDFDDRLGGYSITSPLNCEYSRA